VVTQGRDEAGQPVWNSLFLDFALRLGFDIRLCHPYRPQTKGRVESGIKYVKNNFWPGARFLDLADLNRQASHWCETVANVRIHGTTHEQPGERLALERTHLAPQPTPDRLKPFLGEERTVGRDGYVQWDRSWYGLPWPWKPGERVQVQPGNEIVEIWSGDQRLVVHARAIKPWQRLNHPRQWAGIPSESNRPAKEPMALRLPSLNVEKRPLKVYEDLVWAVSGQ
jgi:hypothetical protein